MRLRLALVLIWIMGPAAVWAENYRGCLPDESAVIAEAIDQAKAITVVAASAVGDTQEYARWFGPYSEKNAEAVRWRLKSIATAIRSGAVTAQCDQVEPDGCASGQYAFVYTDRPYHMHLCPLFFTLPSMRWLRPGARNSEFGTREGTVIHELSHFANVAGTEDHCYSRGECSQMAQSAPGLAVENADSFQYFTEDVTFFARQRTPDKPPPAPPPNR